MKGVASLLAAVLSLSASAVMAEEGEFFLREPFSERPEAGYRWASGWMVSGWLKRSSEDRAFGNVTVTELVATVGKRSSLSEHDGWKTFWDTELGTGFVDAGDRFNTMSLGAYLGISADLTARLGIAARVGASYERRELSEWTTRNELEIGRAQVELHYKW